MYDGDKIIPGLIIFFCLISFPVLYTALKGKFAYVPELEIVTSEKRCVEQAKFMRVEHMNLLKNYWRDSVVREGYRIYTASDGKEYTISLTGTCLDCHPNKTNFCDRCHDYLGIKPACWECHNIPKEN